MVIAIDGPAGVGKSTIAQWIANQYGFLNLNSGAFYRAVAVKISDAHIKLHNENNIIKILGMTTLDIIDNHLYLDGVNVESRLRTPRIDRVASAISAIVEVRHIINHHLRRISGTVDLVAEGRDMTTVVFPDAELKIYLDASVSVRAERRFNQTDGTQTLKEVRDAISERDQLDRNKKEGSLRIDHDAVVLNTSVLTLEQVYEKVSGLIKAYL